MSEDGTSFSDYMVLWLNRLQMNEVLLYSIQEIHLKVELKHTVNWSATEWLNPSSFITAYTSECCHTIQFHVLSLIEVNFFLVDFIPLWYNTLKPDKRTPSTTTQFLHTSTMQHMLCVVILFLFMSVHYGVNKIFYCGNI
jgi:hypothetical protein